MRKLILFCVVTLIVSCSTIFGQFQSGIQLRVNKEPGAESLMIRLSQPHSEGTGFIWSRCKNLYCLAYETSVENRVNGTPPNLIRSLLRIKGVQSVYIASGNTIIFRKTSAAKWKYISNQVFRILFKILPPDMTGTLFASTPHLPEAFLI